MMIKRTLGLIFLILVTTFFSQDLLTAIIILGWTYRWVGYLVKRRLFRLSPLSNTFTWNQFLIREKNNNQDISNYSYPKLWETPQQIKCLNHPRFKWLHRILYSLKLHFKIGLSGILATWIFTLIPCLLCAYAWYVGWHISFNKMYEQSETGASLGFLGTILFTVIMLYVTLAQARYALTKDWRIFLSFKLIKIWVCHRPLQLFILAISYLFSSFILFIIKIIPVFLPIINPDLESLNSTQALQFLNDYYFWTGIISLGLFFALKMMAGFIYSGVLVETWQKNIVTEYDLHQEEIYYLNKFRFSSNLTYSNQKPIQRIIISSVSIAYRSSLIILIFFTWFLFSFLPFISEFFNYYPQRGFLNQPLVQIPCFRYVPQSLEDNKKRV
ncbi:hypothetical protein [Crocosphaera watsonii]|uniref:Uncharacterized protein n=1 Tax=Crocosphaera watsonii WH 8502 TaxID=423474 RepID=T2IHQ4_CROWT|nr:hypothetical protein [Crocosphaera watsonii]CCQ52362.1 hypothetical protein CWATWH8502_4068 [Crocosphaera watsonii WH 8502]